MGIPGLENKMASMDATPAPEPKLKAPEPTGGNDGGEQDAPKDIATPKGSSTPDGGGEGDSGSDVQDALKDAADKAVEKFEFEHVIDGQPVKKSYTKAEVQRMLQKAEGADKRFQEASRIEKREQQLIWLAQNRPDQFLKIVGHDPERFAHDLILKKIEYENMSPEQRQAMENTDRLRMIEEENKRLKYEHEQRQMSEKMQHARQQYATDIKGALTEAKLPVNQFTTRRVAHYLMEAYGKMGVKLPAKDVMPLVREDYINEQRSLFSESDPDTLVNMFGEDVLKRFREYELKRVQTAEQQKREKGRKKNNIIKTDASQKPFKTMDDFRAHTAAIVNE